MKVSRQSRGKLAPEHHVAAPEDANPRYCGVVFGPITTRHNGSDQGHAELYQDDVVSECYAESNSMPGTCLHTWDNTLLQT